MNAHSEKPRTAPAPPHGDVTIRLSNISKFYSGVPALRDVSVEFYAGEVHAILGENGAGKSTLMNIISGAVQPELGEIWLGDRRIANMSPEIAASLGISISFQHPAILDDLSVLENLQVALPASVFAGKDRTDRGRGDVGGGWPARSAAHACRDADGGAEASARNRQGLGDQAKNSVAGRAHRLARPRFRPRCCSSAFAASSRPEPR